MAEPSKRSLDETLTSEKERMGSRLWKQRWKWSGPTGIVVLFMPAASGAETVAAEMVSGADTAWVLISSALVLAMIVPGLALFYGGLVRSKNVLGTIMQSFVILCLVSVLWILLGYSLAFGPDKWGLIGGWEWVGLQGVGLAPHPPYGPTIPHQAFMIFQ